jgi:hypothetical protein
MKFQPTFWSGPLAESNPFTDQSVMGWHETSDGCWSLLLPDKPLPQAVVHPMFSSEEDHKWMASFYGHGLPSFFSTKEEAMAYAVAVLRMGGL